MTDVNGHKEDGTANWQWGRAQSGNVMDSVGAAFMMLVPPFFTLFLIRSCHHNKCALRDTLADVVSGRVDWSWIPVPTATTWAIYIVWFAIHVAAYYFVPGPTGYGQPTPAGHTLKYKVNGWNIWWLTHGALVAAVYLNVLDPKLIQMEWERMWTVLNIVGYFWTFFAYFKAYHFPSHADDRKFSGSTLYDLFMGIEANPRFGDWFDFKLFFNGRPGIGGWTVINLSFTRHSIIKSAMSPTV